MGGRRRCKSRKRISSNQQGLLKQSDCFSHSGQKPTMGVMQRMMLAAPYLAKCSEAHARQIMMPAAPYLDKHRESQARQMMMPASPCLYREAQARHLFFRYAT